MLILLAAFKRDYIISRLFSLKRVIRRLLKKPMKLPYNPGTDTFIGTTTGKRAVFTPDDAKNVLAVGTTGSGKTVLLANYVKRSVDMNYPALIMDGKGDTGSGSLLDITHKIQRDKKAYVISMTDPERSDKFNPFRGASPTIAKDMLINMTEWSEEHYKLNTERYLQRLVQLMHRAKIPLSFQRILLYMDIDRFKALSAKLYQEVLITKTDHSMNTELIKTSGKIAENASARFATIAESEQGLLFADDGIDTYTAMQEKAIILFILNPMIFPELSPLMGRLVTIDSKKAVSKLYQNPVGRALFIMDEIGVYASPTLLDLVNKARSAGITCILAAQGLADLAAAVSEFFKEQIIENCNNFITLRQNSSVNAEDCASIIGTEETMEMTHQLQQTFGGATETGYGSARPVRKYIYHPDEIKALPRGKAVYISRDLGYHCKFDICKPF